ncbi:MAG: DUF3472 domain-containing protein [Ruminococcaceae bacterium]|nr:DUF3472 domain-containing protein [Oscillospiraceae bacterium]
MKKTIKIAIILTLVAILATAPVSSAFAANYMAYNIYSDPVTTGTSGKFDTFTIEFRGVQTPNYTYWALANFGLDLSSIKTMQKFPAISGGGAYAGLQNRDPQRGKAAIMSFWEMRYMGTKIHNVKQMYPEGDTNFTGEGEGKSCIVPFHWDDNTWYRMVIHTWEDVENGTTFAGQWFQNMATGEWTLTIVYDTQIYDSCFKGGMGLFQENYIKTYEDEREFNTKNIYAVDHKTKEWVSLATCNVSYGNGGGDNKAGAHSFGATEEYFWGKAGGTVEDQEQYEKDAIKSQRLTIKQPATPTFTTPELTKLTVDGTKVSWELSKTGMPQLSYKLDVIDTAGKTIFSKEQTRPEVTSTTLEGVDTDAYKVVLTVTDLFGKTTTKEYATEAFLTATPTPTPEPTPAPETTTPADTEAPAATEAPATAPDTSVVEPKPNNTGIIVAVAAVAVVVIGGVVFFVMKKKK